MLAIQYMRSCSSFMILISKFPNLYLTMHTYMHLASWPGHSFFKTFLKYDKTQYIGSANFDTRISGIKFWKCNEITKIYGPIIKTVFRNFEQLLPFLTFKFSTLFFDSSKRWKKCSLNRLRKYHTYILYLSATVKIIIIINLIQLSLCKFKSESPRTEHEGKKFWF